MFHPSKKRLQALRGAVDGLLGVVDDMLVGAPPEDFGAPRENISAPPENVAVAREDLVVLAPQAAAHHPHRRPVRLRLARRDGAIAPRSLDCLCPVRGTGATRAPVDRNLAR